MPAAAPCVSMLLSVTTEDDAIVNVNVRSPRTHAEQPRSLQGCASITARRAQVGDSDSVDTLKAILEAETGVATAQQRLLHNGNELADGCAHSLRNRPQPGAGRSTETAALARPTRACAAAGAASRRPACATATSSRSCALGRPRRARRLRRRRRAPRCRRATPTAASQTRRPSSAACWPARPRWRPSRPRSRTRRAAATSPRSTASLGAPAALCARARPGQSAVAGLSSLHPLAGAWPGSHAAAGVTTCHLQPRASLEQLVATWCPARRGSTPRAVHEPGQHAGWAHVGRHTPGPPPAAAPGSVDGAPGRRRAA